MNELLLLRRILTTPRNLRSLISNSTGKRIQIIDQFEFSKLPITSSEPTPREVYCVKASSGEKYFIKLNQLASKIENEYIAYKLIRNYASHEFSSPEILDMQIDVRYGEGREQQCSWLVEPWLEVNNQVMENNNYLAVSTRILSRINAIEIDLQEAGKLLSISVPDKSDLAENARLNFIAELKRDLPILDKNISKEFLMAIECFEKGRFPYMFNLNHGDFHMGNLMAGVVGHKAPIVLDWEDCAIENPIYDLSHFMFFLHPNSWSLVLSIYFDHIGNVFKALPWHEIAEMTISMYSIWAARNLRWSARRIDDPSQLSLCHEKVTAHYQEIRRLSWKNLVR